MRHTKPRYRLSEAFALLGLPRSSGYERIKLKVLRPQKDGRRTYISAAEIDRYVRDRDRDASSRAPQQQPAA
jgi:hypothetical protein